MEEDGYLTPTGNEPIYTACRHVYSHSGIPVSFPTVEQITQFRVLCLRIGVIGTAADRLSHKYIVFNVRTHFRLSWFSWWRPLLCFKLINLGGGAVCSSSGRVRSSCAIKLSDYRCTRWCVSTFRVTTFRKVVVFREKGTVHFVLTWGSINVRCIGCFEYTDEFEQVWRICR